MRRRRIDGPRQAFYLTRIRYHRGNGVMHTLTGTNAEELMAQYQNGDRAAAASLVEMLSPLLFRYLLTATRNRADAEDCLQDVWLRIHRVRHTHRAGEPVLPWAFAIARHVQVDRYRKYYRVRNHEIAMDILPERPHQAPRRHGPDLNALLSELPEAQREVITLLKVQGLTLEEVARATSSTVGAVKQKAHRAYEKLRRRIQPEGGAAAANS